MKYNPVVAVLCLSLAAPRAMKSQVVTARMDVSGSVSLVNLDVAAVAFGKRVLFELGVSLNAFRDRLDDATDMSAELVLRRAEEAQHNREWSRATDMWQRVLLGNDEQPEHWYAYGEALYNDARYRESIAAFQRAGQLGLDRPADVAMNVARGYASIGNRKQALRWVERALESGGSRRGVIREEPAFERYRNDPVFRELTAPSEVVRPKVATADASVRAVAAAW
ncbi:MAG: tetratricopeptide repeat protein [bacterium]